MISPHEINRLLGRDTIANQIIDILGKFNTHKDSPIYKKGIYIYGAPGCGKTTFVKDILKQFNYDIISYDAGDIRNKTLIDSITHNTISTNNVMELMRGVIKQKVIFMDEIDGMNNGDKGGITSLIKLIRPKKTKKQKNEIKTGFPVICIGNYYSDKKIRELMKVCNVFELKRPTNEQITQMFLCRNVAVTDDIVEFVQGDMRKLEFVLDLYNAGAPVSVIINTIFQKKLFNEDVKQITRRLLQHPVRLCEHDSRMNETDRTIVALLWHENIVDYLPSKNNNTKDLYLRLLDNIRYADYIDRITFQHQIWQFNEMSSLMKTFHCNQIYHDYMRRHSEDASSVSPAGSDVRFTKVLTKYSTEYNNQVFIQNLCFELNMDKKDVIALFEEMRNSDMTLLEKEFKSCNISKLDIRRMYKYLDKNVKKEEDVSGGAMMSDDEEDDDDDDMSV